MNRSLEDAVAEVLKHAPDDPSMRSWFLPDAYRMLWEKVDRLEAARGRAFAETETDAARERLEVLLTGMPSKAPPQPPAPKVDPGAPRSPENRIDLVIGEVFSTTFDGSRDRAEAVAGIARAEVDRLLREDPGLSWLKRRRLRAHAETRIR